MLSTNAPCAPSSRLFITGFFAILILLLISGIDCLHVSALAAVESHLAPVNLPQDLFLFRSTVNRSRACVARSCGASAIVPVSFTTMDRMFGALFDLSQAAVVAYLDMEKNCFAEPASIGNESSSAGRCIAFPASISADCFFDAGMALSYNLSGAVIPDDPLGLPIDPFANSSHVMSFWSYVNDWVLLRAELRLLFGATGNFSTDCSAVVRALASVSASERELVLPTALDFLRKSLRAASAAVRRKWLLIRLTLVQASSTAAQCPEAVTVASMLSEPELSASFKWSKHVQESVINATLRVLAVHREVGNSGDESQLLMPSYCLALLHGIGVAATEDLFIVSPKEPLLEDATLQAVSSLCSADVAESQKASLAQAVSSRIGSLLLPQPATATRACVFSWFSSHSQLLSTSVIDCFSASIASSTNTHRFGADFSQFSKVVSSSASPPAASFEGNDKRFNESFDLWSLVMEWSGSLPLLASTAVPYRSSENLTLFLAASSAASLSSVIDFSSHQSVIFTSWTEMISPTENAANFAPAQTLNASANGTCTKGYFYRIEDDTGAELCTECVNQEPSFAYCPGDQRIHLCANKPLAFASYISQGLRFGEADCPFQCTLPFQYRTGNNCSSAAVGTYPTGAASAASCKLDDALRGSPFESEVVYLSSGLFEQPFSCSRGLRRRCVSAPTATPQQSLLSQFLRWCPLSTDRGITWSISAALNTTMVLAELRASQDRNVTMELASVHTSADGIEWSISLQARDDGVSSSSSSWLSCRIFFNSTAFLGPHFSHEFSVSQSALSNAVVNMRIDVSVDAATGLLTFFVNNSLIGSPRQAADVRDLSGPCARLGETQIVFGGRRAAYDAQPTAVYKNFSDSAALSKNIVPFAGVISTFHMSPFPMPLLGSRVVLAGFSSSAASSLPSIVASSTAASVLFAAAPNSSRLAAVTAAHALLFQDPLALPWMNRSSTTVQCRWGTRLVSGGAGCVLCPTGSLPALDERTCRCLSSRYLAPSSCDMTVSSACVCSLNRSPYPAPVCTIEAALPILVGGSSSTPPVKAISCVVDDSSAPSDAGIGDPERAAAVAFWWTCSSNLTNITQESLVVGDNTPTFIGAELRVVASLAYGVETCEVFAQIREPRREAGSVFSTVIQILPRAPPLSFSNLNVPNSSMVAGDQDSFTVAVANYSFLIPAAIHLFASLVGSPATQAVALAKVQAAIASNRIAARLPNGTVAVFSVNGTLHIPLERDPTGSSANRPIVVTLFVYSAGGLFATSLETPLVLFPYQAADMELTAASTALDHPATVAALSFALVCLVLLSICVRWRQRRPPETPQSPTRGKPSKGRRSRRQAAPPPPQEDSGDVPLAARRSAAPSSTAPPLSRSSGDLGRPPTPSKRRGRDESLPQSPEPAATAQSAPRTRDRERSVTPMARPSEQQPDRAAASAEQSAPHAREWERSVTPMERPWKQQPPPVPGPHDHKRQK
jgi:hypothetical protein